MKTRTLLLLAVVCGLVILLAGGVKLLFVAGANDDTHLAVGATTSIGDMTVTVESFEHADGIAFATVLMVGVDDPDGATTWVFGTGEAQLEPTTEQSARSPICESTRRAEPTRCTLSFITDSTQGVLRYERAGETRRWDVLDRNG